jgi:polysaccharide export outer membrane protein
VNDQLEFVYLLTREKSLEPYQLYVGDVIQISSAIDSSLSQEDITILSDGTISLSLIGRVRVAGKTVSDLQRELNDKYTKYVKNPAIVVQVTESDTPLRDLIQSVDATAGQGGQVRQATVSPDGTVQLPLVGSVPAIGLTLGEIGREINARYRLKLRGVEVTPILIERAARFVYVVGEVDQPGRFEMVGPTSAMQAVALAGGFEQGGNLRQIIVFRRDQNWRLTATKLDLNGALLGKKPHPSDEIWLRDSDIVLIPKRPIQRFSEAVNLYLASTLYAIFPQQGVAFNFDDFTSL